MGPDRAGLPSLARDLWRALPGDLVGRAVVALVGARVTRVVDVEGSGSVLLAEDPRLARWLDAVPRTPTAMTFGRMVLARTTLPDRIVRHEATHVRQWALLGPLFLPAYLGAGAMARLRGLDAYSGNVFEQAATRAEDLPAVIRARAG